MIHPTPDNTGARNQFIQIMQIEDDQERAEKLAEWCNVHSQRILNAFKSPRSAFVKVERKNGGVINVALLADDNVDRRRSSELTSSGRNP